MSDSPGTVYRAGSSDPSASDLFWPGAERAAHILTPIQLLRTMEDFEAAWLDGLVEVGVAPAAARHELMGVVGVRDLDAVARAAEAGGNPVIPLVALLRERLAETAPEAARWVHRGLTSQDVLDSALMIQLSSACAHLGREIRGQVGALTGLVEAHRGTLMVARTLTQHAVPTTFGLKAARWLDGVLDAWDDLRALSFPLQAGGAAGTMAAAVELASDRDDPVEVVQRLGAHVAGHFSRPPAPPWHTNRAPVTRVADAVVRCTDAWARIAGDVLTLSRPEIGELSEGTGGGSSTMPNKENPVLATLVRRAGLTAPQLAATLHLASAESTDERPAGPWHAEWETVTTLARRAMVAGSQTTTLLAGLEVHPERMAATLAGALPGVLAEQRATAEVLGHLPLEDPRDYLGLTAVLVDATLERAHHLLGTPVGDL
jgi:3-carboxy-cis,cis-muconate cycloisomerase